MQAKSVSKRLGAIVIFLLILVGLNMRTGLTIIPPILSNIQHTLHLPSWLLGSLTTIPLLCFAAVSPFVDRLQRRFGLMRLLSFALFVLALGLFIRVYSVGTLLIGTLLLGAGIAVLNVLAPAIVATFFPNNVGGMTSVYSLSMTIFSAISAGISAPVASLIGWKPMIQLIAIFPVLTIAVTLIAGHQGKTPAETTVSKVKTSHQNVWKLKSAWLMTGYMGIQSLLFYTIITWVPRILVDHGLSQNTASIMLGILQLSAVTMSYVIPVLAGHRESQAPFMVATVVLYGFDLGGLLVAQSSVVLAVICCILLGLATNTGYNLAMVLFTLKTRNSSETVAISGMAQSMGYLIAAVGPIAAGALNSARHNWTLVLVLLFVAAILMMVCGLAMDRHKYFFDQS